MIVFALAIASANPLAGLDATGSGTASTTGAGVESTSRKLSSTTGVLTTLGLDALAALAVAFSARLVSLNNSASLALLFCSSYGSGAIGAGGITSATGALLACGILSCGPIC